MTSAMIDTILDRTIVFGYSSPGYRLRSRGWDPDELRSMEARNVLVTGATSGVGQAAAEGFARLGATVWVMARDRERGEKAQAIVRERSGGGDVRVCLCDLGDLNRVRSFVASFAAGVPQLDVLVNNAGVMTAERTLSEDGLELTFATNVVAPFVLTGLLRGPLEAGSPSRVINVSSGGMYAHRIDVDDLQSEQGKFDGAAVYARSKRAEVILTELWAQRLKAAGIVVHAMHPGWVDTPGIQSSLPGFYRATKPLLRTPAQGADTIVWLGAAAAPALSTGGFWHDRVRRPTHLLPRTRESAAERERLWRECERLSALSPEEPASSASTWLGPAR